MILEKICILDENFKFPSCPFCEGETQAFLVDFEKNEKNMETIGKLLEIGLVILDDETNRTGKVFLCSECFPKADKVN